jgi:outer membrane protein OmpA-like peptidoglycan-associated protein
LTKAWLVANEGLAAARLETQGFGAAHFAAPNANPDGVDDPEGRRKSRRVELIILK